MNKFIELKKWFNLDNYEVLKNLTLPQLKKEIRMRHIIHSDLFGSSGEIRFTEHYESIINGDVVTDNIKVFSRFTEEEEDYMGKYFFDHVSAFSLADMISICNHAISNNILCINNNGLISYTTKDLFIHNTLKHAHVDDPKSPIIRFDISRSTDDEIILATKRMLKFFREDYFEPEPEIKRERFSDTFIKKLIDYRIISILDLLIWAKKNNFEFNNEEIARIVFPIELGLIKSGTQIYETILPMAERVITNDFLRNFELFIRTTDEYKKDTPINRFIVFD